MPTRSSEGEVGTGAVFLGLAALMIYFMPPQSHIIAIVMKWVLVVLCLCIASFFFWIDYRSNLKKSER